MSDSGQGGFMHLVPMKLPEGMTGNDIAVETTPWMAPALVGLLGTSVDEPATPIVAIAYETPEPWIRVTEPIAQFDLELLHASRFRNDYLLATKEHLFWSLRKGDDPPDVMVETVDGSRGIECTRFTLPSRLVANGLFRELRRSIGLRPGETYAPLGGHLIYIWFNDPESGLALPPKKSDAETAEEIVEALIAYKPDESTLWVEKADQGLPPQLPAIPTSRTESGATFYSVPMQAAVPDSPWFLSVGFEIALAYTTSHSLSAEWGQLINQIKRKDRAGSDWLLISAGAPDNLGTIYPSEELVLQSMLQNTPPPFALEHLKRVTVHFWSTGESIDLWPAVKSVSRGIYYGSVRAYRTIAPDGAAASSPG